MFPYSQLLVGSSSTIALAGPHVQLIEENTGHILATTTTLKDEALAALLISGPVRCAAVSTGADDGQEYLATAGDDKQLKVWQLPTLTLFSSRELPKKPTSIAFTRTHDILVADKFGDIFRYPLHPAPTPATPYTPRAPGLASHENPSDGVLVLGHASLLTALLLTPDERYIITADRDEHIRVSWFPQGYNIEMYCLGHRKFVSALHLPPSAPELLVSGGGDDELRVWDWLSGRCVASIPVAKTVLPYVVVHAVRPMEEGDKGKRRGKGKKVKRRKGKRDVEERGEELVFEEKVEVEDENWAGQTQEPELIFAVQKIATVSNNDGVCIVFSAIGATALFSVGMPRADASTSAVHALDMGKPVLDFSVAGGSILVSLDAGWGEPGGQMVKVVKMTSGELVYSDGHAALVGSLTGDALISAAPAELEALDLYAGLSALPKHTDTPATAASAAEEGANKKQLGRMKNQQRVLEQLEERDSKRARSD